ncbi:MAG TPA: hypothetical protein VM262_18645, partial [Acidimicrobiales bacterium]|nr:hypothetical protein [Acidimicrobiales bacterium]
SGVPEYPAADVMASSGSSYSDASCTTSTAAMHAKQNTCWRRMRSAAVRLGGRVDPPTERVAAAERILRQHVFCFACIAAVLVVQLASL